MTLHKMILARRRRQLARAIALSLTLCATATVHAQPINLPRQAPPPTQPQIQQTLQATLLCEWPTNQTMPGFGEFWYVHRHLVKQHEANADPRARARDTQDGTNTLGAFEVFGIHFDEIKVAGFMGGGAGLGWSATGDKEALLEELRKLGYVFETIPNPFRGAATGLQGRHPDETGVRAVLIFDGRLESLAGPIRPGGFSLLCRPNRGA